MILGKGWVAETVKIYTSFRALQAATWTRRVYMIYPSVRNHVEA